MKLLEEDEEHSQFLPYFSSRYFGDYRIDANSPRVEADINPRIINQKFRQEVKAVFKLGLDMGKKKEVKSKLRET